MLSDKDFREKKDIWNLIPQTSTGKKATTTLQHTAEQYRSAKFLTLSSRQPSFLFPAVKSTLRQRMFYSVKYLKSYKTLCYWSCDKQSRIIVTSQVIYLSNCVCLIEHVSLCVSTFVRKCASNCVFPILCDYVCESNFVCLTECVNICAHNFVCLIVFAKLCF